MVKSRTPVAPLPALTDALPSDRYITYSDTQTCRQLHLQYVSQWSVSRLFSVTPTMSLELTRFCVFVPLSAAAVLPPGLNIQRDGMLVSPQGLETGWTTHRDRFFNQIDPLVHPIVPDPANPVVPTRIALVDTAPARNSTGYWDPAGHAHTLGRLIADATCPYGLNSLSGVCLSKVHYQLALPLVRTTSGYAQDPINGGYFGRVSHLGTAIVDAVMDWEQTRVSPQEKLVVNLSVGWLGRTDSSEFGDLSEGWRPPTQGMQPKTAATRAVAAGLAYVICRGGLTFAAAGNATGGRDFTDGPLYPARWETAYAPTPQQCQTYFGATVPQGYVTNRPLVYAVSGVDGTHPIVNARPGSRAPRQAAGAAAVTSQASNGPVVQTGTLLVARMVSRGAASPTPMLTGSSVATAVASMAAAQMWAFDPSLTPVEVADRLVTSGQSSGALPDFAHSSFSGQAKIISLCASANAAYNGPAPLACHLRTVTPLSVPTLSYSSIPVGASMSFPVCPGVTHKETAGLQASSYPCPQKQLYSEGAQPWAGPQPGANPCPHCFYYLPSNKLVVQLDDEFPDILSEAVLYVKEAGVTYGVKLGSYLLQDPWGPNQVLVMQIAIPGISPEQGYISFMATPSGGGAPYSVMSPIYIKGN